MPTTVSNDDSEIEMEKPKVKPKFKIDTNNTCFFCLKLVDTIKNKDNHESDDDEDNSASSFSYHSFMRHLNLNVKKIFSSFKLVNSIEVLQRAEVFVTVCEDCFPLANRLSVLYNELEAIRLHLNACIQSINDLMVSAEEDEERMDALRSRIISRIPTEVVHANIMRNLRKETIEKCRKTIKSTPQVSLRSIHRKAAVPKATQTFKTLHLNVVVNSNPPPVQPQLSPGSFPLTTRKRSLTEEDKSENTVSEQVTIPTKKPRLATSNTFRGTKPNFNFKAHPTTRQKEDDTMKTTSFIRRRVLKCSICGEDYYDSFALQKHKSTHTSDNIQNLSFSCQYCDEVFKFYFTLRAHLLKAHPVEVLRTHVPEDTPDEEIKFTLASIVEKNRESLEDGKSRCLICLKNYGLGLELESHVLVTHFDTVLSGLKKAISKTRQGNNCSVSSTNIVTENSSENKPPDSPPPEMVLDPTTGLLVRNENAL